VRNEGVLLDRKPNKIMEVEQIQSAFTLALSRRAREYGLGPHVGCYGPLPPRGGSDLMGEEARQVDFRSVR
jgi:hypothetical protein